MSKNKKRSTELLKIIDPEKQKAVAIDLLDRAQVFMVAIIQFADVENIGEAEDTFMREASVLWALGHLGGIITRIKQNDETIVRRYLDFPWHALGGVTYNNIDFDEEFWEDYYLLIYYYRVRLINIIDLEKGLDVENVIMPPWLPNFDTFAWCLKNDRDKINPDLLRDRDNKSSPEENLDQKQVEQLKSKKHPKTIAWVNEVLSQTPGVDPDKNIKMLSEWDKSVWAVRKL